MRIGEREFEGKKFKYFYPDALEEELKRQLVEIFDNEQYKRGRRKKNAIYLDIGANIGMATRYFQPYAKQIYAFEPNPDIYQALVENTKEFKNVKTFNLAVAQTTGHDYMFSNDGGDLPQTFYSDTSSAYQIKVDLTTVADILKENKLDHVDVMKIDAEGAEYVILAGDSFWDVSSKIDYIIGESHFIEGAFPDILPHVLKDAGYKHFNFIEDGVPNCYRNMSYTDLATGVKKKWSQPYYTLFEAWH